MGCDENISPISSDLPISIHASRMGCDGPVLRCGEHDFYFNPRIPYGMRQSGVNKWTKAVSISIHASRMGCDMRRHPAPFGCRNFNPRIPYGMRPPARIMAWCSTNFNPRIPYGMRLIFLSLASVSCRYFNPRITYGMRQIRKVKMLVLREFQSTHPVWDATLMLLETVHGIIISIHASRMGCD